MPFISLEDQRTLRDRFKRELRNPVTVRLFTQKTLGLTIPGRECQYCDDTNHLLEELVSLSPMLHLEVVDFYSQSQEAKAAGIDRIPAIAMNANGASNVRFYGIPSGYEFAMVIDDLLTLSRAVSPLSLVTRKKLKRIKEKVHIQVFTTPTCGYCPQVARLAHLMAMDNHNIIADVIEVQEFPFLSQRYMVTGVPKIVINDRVQFVGAVPEATFVDKVLEAVGITPNEKKQPIVALAPELGPSTHSMPRQ